MKLFTGSQIRELDTYTIEHEPIRAIDLMERAAKAITHVITERWSQHMKVVVLAGPGNNGGDALAVARMLTEQGYNTHVFLFNIHDKLSDECATNKQRLLNQKRVNGFLEITMNFDPPTLDGDTIVVDGLFGVGLNKPLAGGFASLVKYINQSPAKVVSIDLPSGLMAEDNTYNIRANIIKADLTLTIGCKKLCMMLADNQPYLGELQVLNIRHSKEFIEKADTQYSILEAPEMRALLRERDEFAHKGQMGNALIIAGRYGMAGAGVLATKACLRAGAGLVSVRVPKRNYTIMQVSVPEAILQIDLEETCFANPVDTEDFDAIGIGPGLGTQENTAIAIISQLRRTQCPAVIDADALNILASHRAWLMQLPKGVIMTPHPKELDRLAGNISNGCFERLNKAQELADKLQSYIILKGHYSALCMPGGKTFFNSTGNAGMATAGSGDVLTGIITALCARGYKQQEACMLGMYLHGLAGDLAANKLGQESLIASDIIDFLPEAFKTLRE